MINITKASLLGLTLVSGLACHKPPCNVVLGMTDQNRQAWLGTSPGEKIKYNSPKLVEDFSKGKLYFSPLDITILDCPECTSVKTAEYKGVDKTVKDLFETYFEKLNIVKSETAADYIVSGKLVSVEKNSLGQIIVGSILAPALRHDNCVWWFKITHKITNKTTVYYQLLAYGPQETNLIQSLSTMVNDIHKAIEKSHS